MLRKNVPPPCERVAGSSDNDRSNRNKASGNRGLHQQEGGWELHWEPSTMLLLFLYSHVGTLFSAPDERHLLPDIWETVTDPIRDQICVGNTTTYKPMDLSIQSDHWDSLVNVLALSATKTLDMTRMMNSKMNTVVISSYWAIYPDMTGKMILAKEPADANHPCSVPCGLLPTTIQ